MRKQVTAYDQALKLRGGALEGFTQSHSALTQSNALLAQHEKEQRAAAEEARLELQNQIKVAERRRDEAIAIQKSNQASIDLLSQLLGK